MSLVISVHFPSRTVELLAGIVLLAVTVPVAGVTPLMGQLMEVRGLNAMCRHVDTVSVFIIINCLCCNFWLEIMCIQLHTV